MSKGIEEQKNPHLNDVGGRISAEIAWESLSRYLLFLRHKKAYLYARPFCKGKRILDYGCGNGYGSFLLAGTSLHVTAVDINPEIIRACQQKYQRPNLSFQLVEPGKTTNFPGSSFDVVVSFQVIEHVHDVTGYLNQLKQVLKDDGVLMITTPNRKHRLYPLQKPSNPYHLREYGLRQLREQLNSLFKHVTILGVSGSDEINAIEYKRVKKTLLKNFVPGSVKSWLKSSLFKFPGRKNSSPGETKSLVPLEEKILNKYSVDDYVILEEGVGKGLDFLSILRKN